MIYDYIVISAARKAAAVRLIADDESTLTIEREDDRWYIAAEGYENEIAEHYFIPRFLLFVTIYYDSQVLKHMLLTAEGLPDEDVPSGDLKETVQNLYQEYRGEYDFDAVIFDLDQGCRLEFGQELVFKKLEVAQ